MPIDVTENYIRIRVEDPAKFQEDSFRIIWLSEKDKIKAVAGRLMGETKLTIQSILFDKSAWTVAEAKKWVKDHGYTIRAYMDGVRLGIDSPTLRTIQVPITRQATIQDDGEDAQWEMIIEAWASTPHLDRYGTIILPTAFARSMPIFMATQPVMMFNHEHNWTIGRVLDYKITEDGLWVKGGIAPTAQGKDVATLIRYKVVTGMSFQFDLVASEKDEQSEFMKYTDVNVYEIGPCSMLGNPQAVIEQARSLGIELKTLTVPSIQAKGANPKGEPTMPAEALQEKDVKSIVDSSLQAATGGIKQNEVRINEVAQRVEDLVKIQKAFDDTVKGGEKNSGEMRDLIGRVKADFEKAMADLNKEIAEVKAKRSPIITADFQGYTLKDIINMEPSKARVLWPAKADLIQEFHNLNDELVLRDADSAIHSMTNRGNYHYLQPQARIKTLPEWARWERLVRALDTATPTEGAEIWPTDFSGTIHELIRLELKVAPLFEVFPMPTESYKMPVETADVIATKHGQVTTVVTGWDSTEQTPLTNQLTFTALKLRSRIQLSAELSEGAAFPIIPWVQRHAARSIARGLDRAIINGQLTADIDTGGGGVGATDARKMWDGLRYHYQNNVTSAKGVDCGTFSEDNLRKVRQNMGIYGVYASDLVWLCSSIGYLGRFMKDLDQIQTLDKYGPNAVILTGEVLKFDGVPLVVSEFVQDNLNAVGIYDASVPDNTEVILVNRRAWALGTRRETSLAVVRDEINDVYTIVGFWRGDFKPWWTPSTSVVIVNEGYNVSIA